MKEKPAKRKTASKPKEKHPAAVKTGARRSIDATGGGGGTAVATASSGIAFKATKNSAKGEKRYDWTCPTCGFVGRWRVNKTDLSAHFEKIVPIPPQHHNTPDGKWKCAYPGGWWRCSEVDGWIQVQKAPILSPTVDGIELRSDDGGFLGWLPGHNADDWQLHAIRATDPAYPSLMKREFDWLGSVSEADKGRWRTNADSLLGRYCFALERMERLLALLYHKTTCASLKTQISYSLARMYGTIKNDTKPGRSDPAADTEEPLKFARFNAFKIGSELLLRNERKSRQIAAEILRRGEGTRPANSKIREWVGGKMWRVWDVVRNVHGGASPDRVKAECAALSRVITKTQMSRQGFTFPDLWKAWLRNYLFGLWNEERPKNVKGNRPAKFEDVERAVIIGAAEFWCQYLEDFEPDNMRGQNERVEAALRAALKL